ncbi:hypothetical protein [Rhodopirellula sp. MGV]|uniref:hypothetical protein n=1 Tax=Rhodopirellula sp. MGV TaxID=2023130 RepID=UPI000B960484|nr:hypothetical protein [Rhodopirellula sp. MGV]OYP36972.1 hypothetical protein CGZ80_06310 [Rhodopirellula sp. MGV]PNY36265.1 hypothetical protein C2E31_14275 [Rhodopirellula baltica]
MPSFDHGSHRNLNRRHAIGILSALAVTGCGSSSEPTPDNKPSGERRDVPLRIVFDGSEDDAAAIRRAYGTEAEQSLQITAIDSSQAGQIESIIDAVRNSDVAIVSHALIGTLIANETIVDINQEVLDDIASNHGPLLPALEHSFGRYDGLRWGVAAGAKPLAVLSLDPDLTLENWADYHTWLGDKKGKSGEPLATSWAANSFLNRCALTIDRAWLFDRLTLKAQINQPEYVEQLQALLADSKLYASTEMTPAMIYNGIRQGELKGGIAFQTPITAAAPDASAEFFDVSATACPNETETERLWLGRQTLIACVSTGCRQTEASRRFVGWISGTPSHSTLTQQTELVSPTRTPRESTVGGQLTGYARWAKEQLNTSLVVSGPWLPNGTEYYQVLDDQVRRCIGGETDPQAALNQVAERWNEISDRNGIEKQTAAWKKLDV